MAKLILKVGQIPCTFGCNFGKVGSCLCYVAVFISVELSTDYFILFVFFSEFIEGVSQFSVKGDKESKLKCK